MAEPLVELSAGVPGPAARSRAGGPAQVDQILRKIGEARELYHRLILMVGPAGSGKTKALQDVATSTSALLINVNLELSRRMLELTERQRALQLPRLLGEIMSEATGDPPAAAPAAQAGLALLDNIEILFDVHLKQDPLRLLQGLSRNKTVVAAWSGEYANGFLVYAEPMHREYRRYKEEDISGILIVNSGVELK